MLLRLEPAMNQLAPANSESLSAPTCRDCGVPMRLFGIEAHPTVERTDLRTYVCSTCDGVQTENVPLLLHGRRTLEGEPLCQRIRFLRIMCLTPRRRRSWRQHLTQHGKR